MLTNRHPFEHGDTAPAASRFSAYVTGKRWARRCLVACLVPVSVWAAPAPAPYVDLSLEQLMDLKIERVYGASRHEQKVTHAPSSVSIVTGDDVRRFGWRTLGDLLRSVRGLYVSDDRNYSYVGARGFLRPGDYNTRLLLLVDGHRLNDNVYHGAYVGRDAINPELIERVEVIRGPSSSVYGSSAFFGVVNVVTKSAAQLGNEGVFAAGNLGTYEGRLSLARTFRSGVEVLVSGSYYTATGERSLYFPEFDQRTSMNPLADNNGVAENLDDERAAQAFTRVTYRALTLSAFVSRRRKDIPTASFESVFNHPETRTVDRRGYLDAKFDQEVGSSGWRVTARLFYDQFRYDGWYPFDYAVAGPREIYLATDGADGEWAGTEWQLNVPLSARQRLIGGFEFRYSFHEDQFADYGEPATDLHDHRSSRVFGAFAQWEAEVHKTVRLTAGMRYDHYYGTFGGTTNPRVGVIYSPDEASAAKLLYGRAFRAPSAYEKYYYTAQTLAPMLQPERIATSELVLERYFGRSYRANVSGYYYETERLITQRSDPVDGIYFSNADATETRGVEAEVEARWDAGLLARASYAQQRSRDRVTRAELTSSPRGLGKLNLGWNAERRGVSSGVEAQYQTATRTLSGARVGSFAIVNLNFVATKLLPGCEVAVSVFNLLDRAHAYPGAEDHAQDAIRQVRRTWQVKVMRRF